ncbi:hypothetical protein ISN45_At03g054830 [Arabidopsis thaliana x Arabidopsis arenosa]|uniref:Uncharacterized protein n=2 Tax=Arabidopsis TaxID=3701 RepID=A0A8T2FGZ4_ARASU|nr:hypothetical protein ISN45_At03g054830 [Arabidopsis thaliana x Arabidopsis arenosa]KAG7635272.1 hypothetical protein ISN44_As03g053780 [Arabidopsis suecica]
MCPKEDNWAQIKWAFGLATRFDFSIGVLWVL